MAWPPGLSICKTAKAIPKSSPPQYPNYFKEGLPYLDELTILGILDESAQLVRQLAHQSDWHWVCTFGQYDEYVDHDQILTVIKATRGHHSIWLNSNNPPFDNVNVRQAIF